jgi:hypothetical protein
VASRRSDSAAATLALRASMSALNLADSCSALSRSTSARSSRLLRAAADHAASCSPSRSEDASCCDAVSSARVDSVRRTALRRRRPVIHHPSRASRRAEPRAMATMSVVSTD